MAEPLTEEELANLQSLADHFPDHHIVPVGAGRLKLLIADLRAKNERIKELEAEVAWFNERVDGGEI